MRIFSHSNHFWTEFNKTEINNNNNVCLLLWVYRCWYESNWLCASPTSTFLFSWCARIQTNRKNTMRTEIEWLMDRNILHNPIKWHGIITCIYPSTECRSFMLRHEKNTLVIANRIFRCLVGINFTSWNLFVIEAKSRHCYWRNMSMSNKKIRTPLQFATLGLSAFIIFDARNYNKAFVLFAEKCWLCSLWILQGPFIHRAWMRDRPLICINHFSRQRLPYEHRKLISEI